MTHLFKLKKDGETVGYLGIANNGKTGGLVFSLSGDLWNHITQEGQLPQFDSAHPFVCKDKNDKDVFADDPCLLHCFSPPKKVYPKWNQEYLRYELWENGTAVISAIEDTYKRHIELLEEKK